MTSPVVPSTYVAVAVNACAPVNADPAAVIITVGCAGAIASDTTSPSELPPASPDGACGFESHATSTTTIATMRLPML